MKAVDAVKALGALAHGHRLAIFRLLVERGPGGMAAGAIAARVDLVPSALTFHVQSLVRAGLVSQRRAGRNIFYAVSLPAMNGLVAYLTENCCGGPGSCAPVCVPAPPRRTAGKGRRAA